LEQNGVYLVFSAVLTPKDRPFAYRFNLWIVSSDYQQTGGAFETIDSVLELWRRETREFGRADWTIGEAVLERIDGALSAFRIAITIF
jgi:hypothetical protein